MLLSNLSFIFKLGKYRSLPFKPLRPISMRSDSSLLPPATTAMQLNVPVISSRAPHSNQMSS